MTLTAAAADAAVALTAATTAVSDAEAELQRLVDSGTAAQAELDAEKAAVTAAESTLTTLQSDAGNAAVAVTAKEGAIATAEGELTVLQANATKAARGVTAKNAEITQSAGRAPGPTGRREEGRERLRRQPAAILASTKTISDLNAQLATSNAAVVTKQSDLKKAQDDRVALAARQTFLTAEITRLQGINGGNQAARAVRGAQIAAHQTELAAFPRRLTSRHSRLSSRRFRRQ